MSMIVVLPPPEEWATLCPVCGYDLGYRAWETRSSPSGRRCPCCGVIFGLDDTSTPDNPSWNQVLLVHLRAGWIRGWHMAWMGNEDHPRPPDSWDPLMQVLRLGLDLRSWYPEWAAHNPPEDNPTPFYADDPRHLGDWTRYDLKEAQKALSGGTAVAVEVEAHDAQSTDTFYAPASMTVKIVREKEQGGPVALPLFTLFNVDFALARARALADVLDVPFHAPSA